VLVADGAFPRELPAAGARAIFAATTPPAKRVALSLSTELAEVVAVARETRPDVIQVQAAAEDFPIPMLRAQGAVVGNRDLARGRGDRRGRDRGRTVLFGRGRFSAAQPPERPPCRRPSGGGDFVAAAKITR
jgi:hypothetical protein